jgi:hypothetical protein
MQPSWGDPEPIPTFTWDEAVNQFLIFILGGTHPQWTTSFGTKPAPRGTVVMLTGPRAGEVIDDRLLLSGGLAGALKDKPPGFLMVARVTKNGKAFGFEPGADYGRDLANRWAAANPGRLDMLIQEAMRAFHEAASRPQQQPAQPVPASPQFQQPPPAWQVPPTAYGTPVPQAPPPQYAAPAPPTQPPPATYAPQTYATPYAAPSQTPSPEHQPVLSTPDISQFPAGSGPAPASQPEQPPF